MSDVTANFATDRQTRRYSNGEEWMFYAKVNLDDVITELARRAKKSKRGVATALSGAVRVSAKKVRP